MKHNLSSVILIAFVAFLFSVPSNVFASNPGYCDEGGSNPQECEMPPICIAMIAADPNPITQGQGTNVSWGSSNCGCAPDFDDSGATPDQNGYYYSKTFYPNTTTTYSVHCSATNAMGTSNAYNSVTVTVNAAYADVYAGATSPASATVGQAVTLSSSVTNQGNSTATNFPNVFQISGVGYVAAQTHTLGSGGSTGISASYTFPTIGNYSVRACADTNTSGSGALSESDEGNNCGAWTTIAVNPSGACYATPDGTSLPNGTGSHTMYAYNVPPAYAQLWFATWSDVGGQDDIIWHPATALGNGAFSATINLASHTGVGTYSAHAYLGNGGTAQVYCDTANFTREGLSDLTSGATSASYASNPYPVAGAPFTLTSTVSNIGNWTATNFPNMFHVSGVTLFGAQTHTLGAGGSAAISSSATIGTPGVYNIQSCADYNTSWGTTVSESNESNNCGGWTSVSVTPTAPTGVTASCNANGTSATLSWNATSGASAYYVRINKIGTCPSGWQQAGWDANSCVPNPDWVTGTSIAFPMAPGSSHNWWIHAALSNGAYGPSTGAAFTCQGQIDLTVSSISPTTVASGQASTMSATVNNSGNVPTGAGFPNTFWFDTDTNLNNGNLGNVQAPTASSLGAGSSVGASASWTAPATPGTYYGVACTDNNASWGSAITESNEGNNCGPWTTITVTGPNLVAGSVISGTTLTAGVAGTLYSMTYNTGNGPTGGNSVTAFQRASDSAGTGAATVGFFTVGNILAGGQQQASTAYTPPTPGVWYFRSCVDWNGQITESNESNCGAWEPLTVTASDLTASNLAPGAGAILVNTPITFNGRVNNVGNGTATNIPSIFQVCDNNCATLNTSVSGTAISSLAAGANNSSVFGSYTFTNPGTYYYRTCADTNVAWAGANVESNEANNCDAWSTITISAPDLTASVIGQNSAVVNSAITLTATVSNIGNGTGTNIPNVFNVYNDSTGTSILVGAQTHTLAASASAGISASYAFPSVGTYSVRACSDVNTSWAGTVTEWNEGNNCSAWVTVTVSYPSIVASCSASPTSIFSNQSTTWTASASGGNGSYTYSWSGTDSLSGTGSSVVKTYTTPGVKTGSVTVTSNGVPATVACSNSVTVTGQSDLTASATTFTAQSGSPYVWAGTPFTFNSIVSNVGNVTATNFPNMFTIDTVGQFAAQTHTVAASASAAISGTYTFANAGTYRVQSCADYNTTWGSAIAESNESNNCGGWLNFSVAPPAPTGLTAVCNANGTAINFSWNASPGASFYYVRITKPAGSSCPTGWQTAGWAPDQCIPNPDNWVPTSVSNYPVITGTAYSYWVHASLSNGTWGPSTGSAITCSGVAELTAVNSAPASGASVTAGSAAPFSAQINNTGTGAASTVRNILQIENGSVVNANPVLASVPAGGSGAVTSSYTFPLTGSFPRTERYRFCADNNTSWVGTVPETDEGNNCAPWTSVTLNSECTDGGDNDADGKVDGADPGCPADGTETGDPTVSFTSTPSLIRPGETATLAWSSTGAPSCTGTGFSTGGATSGSVQVTPTQSSSYSIDCGGVIMNITTNVTEPRAYITAEPTSVDAAGAGGNTTVYWSASEVTSCTITTPFGETLFSGAPPAGTSTIAETGILKQTRYTLSCTPLTGQNVVSSVLVNPLPQFDEF